MTYFEELGRRFAGVDIQFRRDRCAGWLGLWRVRVMTSKSERDAYRITLYADTLEELERKLVERIQFMEALKPFAPSEVVQ